MQVIGAFKIETETVIINENIKPLHLVRVIDLNTGKIKKFSSKLSLAAAENKAYNYIKTQK